MTVEVKRDWRVSDTANLAVEYEGRNGRRSGITSTKADYWAFVFDGEGYEKEVIVFVKTSRLRRLIAAFAKKHRTKNEETQASFSKFKLLPIRYLLSTNEEIAKEERFNSLWDAKRMRQNTTTGNRVKDAVRRRSL